MRSHDIIGKMLQERQELLVAFCELTGLEPFSREPVTTQPLALFCQTLVDYAGLAHFELFEKLADEAAAESDIRDRARVLYLPLVESTQRLVDFNDKYDAAAEAFSVDPLADDLSRLGENLAARFELEDALIQLLRELEA
jgi:regulator of sigma D